MSKVYIGGNTIETSATMKPRAAFDYYRTDPAAVEAYFNKHPLFNRGRVLDPCMGDGVWGKEARTAYPSISELVGNDIQPEFAHAPDCIQYYDVRMTSDFLEWTTRTAGTFDAVIANPPFRWAEAFFHKSVELLSPNGSIVFLLRLGFLASERRYKSMYSAGFMPSWITVLNTRPSFSGDNKTYPGDFCVLRWDFFDGQCRQLGLLDNLVYTRRGLELEEISAGN